MTPFADRADLAAFLQDDDVNEESADLAVVNASGVIRAHLGWSVTAETGVEHVTEGDGTSILWVPTLRLTAVTAVTENDEPLTFADDYRWSRHGRVRRIGDLWPMEEQSVTITYSHGFDEVPDAVRAVTLAFAGRMYSNPESIRSWSLDGVSETTSGPREPDAGHVLFPGELAMLSRFRLVTAWRRPV